MGQVENDTIHIVMDEVTYGSGGRWGQWSAGGGSSLELKDPRSDRRLAPNWADSDESTKSDWVTVEATGVMDHGWADAYQLHVTILGAGEALVDNIEVIPAGGVNQIANGTFNSGVTGWTFQGNHNQSGWDSEGFGGAGSLHLRASGRGDTGSNRTRTQLPATLAPGTTVTLRAKVRWLKGNPNVLLRLRGNWMEAAALTLSTQAFGTPALPNSRLVQNTGPAITDVRHFPALPAANQPVLVMANIHDPDGLAFLAVQYRIDPNTNFTTLAMTNNGAGVFSTILPPQNAGVTAVFFVQASDNFPVPGSSSFPNNAPVGECVVRWGDNAIPGTLPTYRFWISQTNITRWSVEEKMSNNPKDITFIYGTNRVIYNAGGWFHGSPYHSPSYNSPVGSACDYDLRFPDDDRLMGETDINLFRPGNGGGDGTGQREIQGYWFGDQFGIPYLYHRPVFVYVNGLRRETVFHDAQQPNGDFVNQWFPDDADGELHKIQLGFEFGDLAYGNGEPGYAVVGANLARYNTTGGQPKIARYRQTWPLRSVSPVDQLNYSNLFALVQAVNTSPGIGSDNYTATLTGFTDVEEWYKVHVVQHLINNGDSFSYGGGQNAFAYKPQRDPWKLFLWDIDFAFGGVASDANLTGIGGSDHGPRNDHPPFGRIYWQALIEAANGMLTSARSNPILDARYNGMVAAGAGVGSPQQIKDFINERRNLILSRIQASQSPFAITSNGGAGWTTNRNLITLTGTAPLEVRTLLINGQAYPTRWTALGAWEIRVPLSSGSNALQVVGIDPFGNTVANASGIIGVYFIGMDERPEDRVVINEIMYNPLVANSEFIEFYNSSISNAFDMSGWRLEGADFTFPDGVVIEPGAYVIIARDRAVFAATYNASVAVAGEFAGNLDNGGETLTLIAPGPTPEQDRIIDQVTYDDDSPWSNAADGQGSSLQLIDLARDNNRAGNWMAVSAAPTNAQPLRLLSYTNVWRFDQVSDLSAVNWKTAAYNDTAWGSGPGLLYNETAALPGPKNTPLNIGRLTYYFRTRFTPTGNFVGASLKLWTILDDGAVFYLNGQEIFRLRIPAGTPTYSTLTDAGIGDATIEGPFLIPNAALLAGENVLAVEVHQSSAGSSDIVLGVELETTFDVVSRTTPGGPNSTRASLPVFPLLWLNEVLPNNFFLGTNGITDAMGERDPWVELYNGSTNDLNLTGYALANNFSNLNQWPFPPNTIIRAGQFLVVWLDGEPEESTPLELHANFRAAPDAGSIALSRTNILAPLVDHLNYAVPVGGRSYGSFPDGQVSGRRVFSTVTPRAPNNPLNPPVDVRINEWMSDNAGTLADPLDGRYEDWFELYNAGDEAADLSGYYLSDSMLNSRDWKIPDGTFIPAHGHLLVWADSTPDQNGSSADLHADFSLARDGEAIALFAPDGTLIDALQFEAQTPDVSGGRYPDGNASFVAMNLPTPRSANLIVSDNTPPSLSVIGDQTVDEGFLLSLTAVADDQDIPAQRLRFSLDPSAPAGTSIDPDTGLFRWIPEEVQGPGMYQIIVRVTDNGLPPISSSRGFNVTVREINNAPSLTPINSQTLPEEVLLVLTNRATDTDSAGPLQFFLDPGFPAGMTLDANTGVLRWRPSEAQGPGDYSIVVGVRDDGDPPLEHRQSFTVSVREDNRAPSLSFPATQSVAMGSLLTFVPTSNDPDLPRQVLRFSLGAGAPAAAGLDSATGQFSWTPNATNTGSNSMMLIVTDDGVPPQSTSRTLTVLVTSDRRIEIQRNGSMVTLRFGTTPGKHYQVQNKKTLTALVWSDQGSPILATSDFITVPDTVSPNQQRYYRIVETD